MAKSTRTTYTAADRHERRATHRPRRVERRAATRQAVIARELQASR